MLDRLSGVLGSTQQDGVRPCRCSQSQLIQRQAFSARSLDPGTCSSGKSQSSDAQLRDLQQTIVVRHRADHDDRLAVVGLAGVLVGNLTGNA